MSFFGFGTKVSKPAQVPTGMVPGQRVNWKGTNIMITYDALPGGGNYVATVSQHLSEIGSFPIGQQFLHAIQVSGKNVVIVYGGANTNQAAGSPMGYCMLRKHHDAWNAASFGQELDRMIVASGKSKQAIALELYRLLIPTWQAGTIPSPFRTISRLAAPVVGPGRPLPQTPGDAIVAKLDAWIAGTAPQPTNDEIDAILLVLEQWVLRGSGVGTRINYDPHKTQAAGLNRPPQVALFHELTHAYYNALGMQLGREDSLNENNGGRLFELMAVGMPPFNMRPYSENKFRGALGVAVRQRYP